MDSSPKTEILSSFIHLHVDPNWYDLLSSVDNKRRYAEKCFNVYFCFGFCEGPVLFWTGCHCMDKNS